MAITIQRQAPAHCFVYNPLWWVVSSTNTAQSNFRFVCDIYITGQTFAGASYLRLKTPVDPVNNRGVFNVNPILERYVTYDISIATGATEAIKQASNSVIEYQLKFGEEYGPSSAVTVFPDLTVSSAKFAHNSIQEHIDYLGFIQTSGSVYLNASASAKKFLTNSPRDKQKVRSEERLWLQMINDSASDQPARAYVETYNSSDVLLSTLVFRNNYTTLSSAADRRIIVPAGYNIDDVLPADIVSGSVPVISAAACSYWKIWMVDTSNVQKSEKFTLKKDSTCIHDDGDEFRIHFLNELGGLDSFTFFRAHKHEVNIKERKIYSKPPGKFIALNNYMFESSDRLDIAFYTEMKETITLHSDWIDEDTSKWLEELVCSPVVMVQDVLWTTGPGDAADLNLPVTITDKQYIRKQRSTDRLFNLVIKIQPTYNRYRQRA